jgi:hypothetical protein
VGSAAAGVAVVVVAAVVVAAVPAVVATAPVAAGVAVVVVVGVVVVVAFEAAGVLALLGIKLFSADIMAATSGLRRPGPSVVWAWAAGSASLRSSSSRGRRCT